jgi:hypothetical protein
MRDSEIAKQLLKEGYSLAVVRNGECIFTHKGNWIHPIVEAYEQLGDLLSGASVADRVIGKAAAVVCIRSSVAHVYTPMASRSAVAAFTQANIPFMCDSVVDGIMNKSGTDLCLAEKTLLDIQEPDVAFCALWRLLGKDC